MRLLPLPPCMRTKAPPAALNAFRATHLDKLETCSQGRIALEELAHCWIAFLAGVAPCGIEVYKQRRGVTIHNR